MQISTFMRMTNQTLTPRTMKFGVSMPGIHGWRANVPKIETKQTQQLYGGEVRHPSQPLAFSAMEGNRQRNNGQSDQIRA